MASTVVSFEMAVAATDVASFDASPEKATLEANLKNELSCLEPALEKGTIHFHPADHLAEPDVLFEVGIRC